MKNLLKCFFAISMLSSLAIAADSTHGGGNVGSDLGSLVGTYVGNTGSFKNALHPESFLKMSKSCTVVVTADAGGDLNFNLSNNDDSALPLDERGSGFGYVSQVDLEKAASLNQSTMSFDSRSTDGSDKLTISLNDSGQLQSVATSSWLGPIFSDSASCGRLQKQ